MSALRRVLAEVSSSRGGGVSLDEIADRLDLDTDEVSGMVDYWVRRGVLDAQTLGPCGAGGGCGSCPSGNEGAPGCGRPTRAPGPQLVAITLRPRP